MSVPALRLGENSALVPCDWTYPVHRALSAPALPVRWPPPTETFEIVAMPVVYHRRRYYLATMWTRVERRELARSGTRGRRGARRVAPVHRVEVHVYLQEGTADTPGFLAQIEALLRAQMPAPKGRKK